MRVLNTYNCVLLKNQNPNISANTAYIYSVTMKTEYIIMCDNQIHVQ